jgi:hypothetical protein
MSELPRRIVSQLRRFIGNRRRCKRVRTRLTFTLSLSDPKVSSNGARRLPALNGHTLDISTPASRLSFLPFVSESITSPVLSANCM